MSSQPAPAAVRLHVLVEGQTEEQFVEHLLAPHLADHAVYATPIIVTTSREPGGRKRHGGGNWAKWERDLRRLLPPSSADARLTTLFDLYGLPPGFPGLDRLAAVADTNARCTALEQALGEHVGDRRFVPYLQRHEFEALVLAGLPALRMLLDAEDDLAGLDRLAASLGATPPEDVNDGRDTAPSKRLEAAVPSYQKPVHGPLVVHDVGLPALRARCPRLDAWVARLERLAGEA